ncbi:MAG: hypothetical protein JW995_03995 [Melioribacteraceae bacterium]|nr:hypothetical protein [Melioribacteraceae bacterium]
MEIKLYQLDRLLKNILSTFLALISAALLVGIIYLVQTTNASKSGVVERWNGSESAYKNEVQFRESFPKPVSEMLVTTHNHLFGFAFIFISVGLIFYYNSTITGFWKSFLIIEPFISAFVTFGSIWLVRFLHEYFVYLTIASAILMYVCYSIMTVVSLYELNMKNN